MTNLGILFDILKEHLIVFFVSLIRVFALLLALGGRSLRVLIGTLLLRKMLELPQSVLPALAVLGIGFLTRTMGGT